MKGKSYPNFYFGEVLNQQREDYEKKILKPDIDHHTINKMIINMRSMGRKKRESVTVIFQEHMGKEKLILDSQANFLLSIETGKAKTIVAHSKRSSKRWKKLRGVIRQTKEMFARMKNGLDGGTTKEETSYIKSL